MRTAQKSEALPSHEILLADYAARLARHLPGRRGVRIHLSRLRPFNRRDHHIRIAASTCESLCKRFEGQLFQLGGGDLVMVVKGAGVAEIDQTIIKLRFLFSDDPLASGEDETEERTFCTWYDLERQYPEFLHMAEQSLLELERRKAEAAQATHAPGESGRPAVPRGPLDPSRLARLEQALSTMDITPMMRRQPIVAVIPGGTTKVLLNELYVSISELGRKVMPDVELSSDRWLFQHLTLTLDQRLLSLVPGIESGVAQACALNLNVATILSPQFLQFDQRLKLATQKTFVLELQAPDIFGDLGAFLFARDFVHDRGYRVCLDGLNHLTFPLLYRNKLDFDFYKIVWSADIEQEVQESRRAEFQAAIREAGPGRVILCHCDSPRAVGFGHSIGITMFQGRHIDELTGMHASIAGGRPAA